MTKRDDLQNIKEEIDEISKKTDELNQRSFSLEDQAADLVIKVLLEEEVLADTQWELKMSRVSQPYLEFSGPLSDELLFKIKELTWGGYTSNFNFEQGVYLSYDEARVSLHFDDVKKVPLYIRRLKLRVDANPIKTTLGRLKKDVMALEMICHQLQIAT